MGCGSSSVFVVNNNIPGQDEQSLRTFETLCLSTNDINILYRAFKELDLSGDNNVNVTEFLFILNIGNNYIICIFIHV
jgi:hypothetical protein